MTSQRWVNLTEAGQSPVVYASAARTATPTTAEMSNPGYRGVHLVINASAASATPSIVFTIQGVDAVSGAAYTILASAAITGTGTTRLTVYPGCIAAANAVANDALPATWRVTAVHGDADSITYSVGANYLV